MPPPVDLSYIADQLVESGEELQRAAEDAPEPVEPAPQVLLAALRALLDTLRDRDAALSDDPAGARPPLSGAELTFLLDHGLTLLEQSSELARRLGLPRVESALTQLGLPLSLWLLRRGADLARPAAAVNAASALANQLRDPEALAELYNLMNELVDGMRATGLPETGPPPPQVWRILLINRAIVATRAHQPLLMTRACDELIEYLPEEAPDFFREGMGQMESLNYPAPIRALMRAYYDRWCTGQRLH